jgi:hypothetical protein
MLGALEQRLLELVAEALAGRDHLVVGPAGIPADPAAGEGTVRVGLVGMTPVAGFEPRTLPAPPGDDETRRVRPLRMSIEAAIEVAQRPAGADADGSAARRLVLDHLARVGHALDAPGIRDGSAFAAGPDAGYAVGEMWFDSSTVPEPGEDGVIRASWVVRGLADVWPPDAAEDAGAIALVSVLTAALPVAIGLDDAVVALGGTTRIHVRGLDPNRAAAGAPAGVRLSARVVSRLLAAGRGTISSGTSGPDGTRLVPVEDGTTTLEYRAPASLPPGAPVERVEVSLAREDGLPTILLGSIAIGLRAAP